MSLRSSMPGFVKQFVRDVAFGPHELAHAYDQLFRIVESGSLVVRIPELDGEFEIGATSHILRRVMVDTRYEPELVEIIRRRIDPRKDAIDIGANVGLLTVLMARLLEGTRRVLSIEPTPAACRLLRANVTRNGCDDRVVVFEGVATRSSGDCLLNYVPGKEEYSSMGNLVHPSIAGGPSTQIRVAGDTVDNLSERFGLEPGLIKIDTEGSEEQVLAGATRTMKLYRPVIVCESWPERLISASGGSPGAVKALLKEHQYSMMMTGCPSDTIVAIPN